MERQLSLWPEEERAGIWKGLDPDLQRVVVDMLARLIGKAVRPNDENIMNKKGAYVNDELVSRSASRESIGRR